MWTANVFAGADLSSCSYFWCAEANFSTAGQCSPCSEWKLLLRRLPIPFYWQRKGSVTLCGLRQGEKMKCSCACFLGGTLDAVCWTALLLVFLLFCLGIVRLQDFCCRKPDANPAGSKRNSSLFSFFNLPKAQEEEIQQRREMPGGKSSV